MTFVESCKANASQNEQPIGSGDSDPSVYDGEINPSKDELDGGRFWTLEEIRAAIGQQTLTPQAVREPGF